MRNKPNVQSALTGTRTEHALNDALAAESLNYTKYSLFADRAEKEGYAGISSLFRRFADEEKAHAALWMGYLGRLGTTGENLNDAVCGSTFENTALYPDARDNAAEEGFEEIADKLRLLSAVKERHTDALRDAHHSLENGTLFEGSASAKWTCANCGCLVRGNTPPDHCPLCGFSKRSFVKEEESCDE